MTTGQQATAGLTLTVPVSHPTYLIWSSNTSLGKTLVSTGLAASSLRSHRRSFLYLKPVQIGYPTDSDSRFVFSKFASLALRRTSSHLSLLTSNHVLKTSASATRSALAPGALQNYYKSMSDLDWY